MQDFYCKYSYILVSYIILLQDTEQTETLT